MTLLFAAAARARLSAGDDRIGQVAVPAQANGSLIRDGRPRHRLGADRPGLRQRPLFPDRARRPRARAMTRLASSGSNLGPAIAGAGRSRRSRRRQAPRRGRRPGRSRPTSSPPRGSGLDPDLQPPRRLGAGRRASPRRAACRPARSARWSTRTSSGRCSASSASRASTCSRSIDSSTRLGANAGAVTDARRPTRPEALLRAGGAGGARPAEDLPRRRARASARPTRCCPKARRGGATASTSSSAWSRRTAAPRPRR